MKEVKLIEMILGLCLYLASIQFQLRRIEYSRDIEQCFEDNTIGSNSIGKIQKKFSFHFFS